MTYSFDGYNYLIRLKKGERLMKSLEQFARETKLEGAWVNGLGAALDVTLRYYDLEAKEYHSKSFEGPLEVASLTGNIAFDQDNKMIAHVHGVFGDTEYQTIAGHVQDCTVGATMELFIHRAYQPTKRTLDQEIGLPLLDL